MAKETNEAYSEYIVTWIIQVTARNPKEAAREARKCQGPGTDALVFSVQKEGTYIPVDVDLSEFEETSDVGS